MCISCNDFGMEEDLEKFHTYIRFLPVWLLASIVESCIKPNEKESDIDVKLFQIFLHSKIIAGNAHRYLFWFQFILDFYKLGESNSNWNQNKYQCAFPAMISEWRKIWNSFTPTSDSFPFGFMQLFTGINSRKLHETKQEGIWCWFKTIPNLPPFRNHCRKCILIPILLFIN